MIRGGSSPRTLTLLPTDGLQDGIYGRFGCILEGRRIGTTSYRKL